MQRSSHQPGRWLTPLLLGAALFALPPLLDQIPSIDTHGAAYAKGGGNGGGGGGGGGNGGGGGHGGDHGGAGESSQGEHGGHGNAYGHESHDEDEDADDDQAKANDLGKLNASHASAQARQHAAANSTVGQIAHYEELVNSAEEDIENEALQALATEALETLENTSNKAVTSEVIDEVNRQLGITEPNAVVDEMKSQLDAGDAPADEEPSAEDAQEPPVAESTN